jgi:phosphopantothenoylcysteine decarboxylase/phosphopantothenate--cysteine ligase
MLSALSREFDQSDLLIMAAAIADVRPAVSSATKLNKSALTEIALLPNPDISKELSARKQNQVMVGFAAQTEASIEAALEIATKKLLEKGFDFIYCNDVSGGAIFGSDTTSGVILDLSGNRLEFTNVGKMTLANKLLDLAIDKLG